MFRTVISLVVAGLVLLAPAASAPPPLMITTNGSLGTYPIGQDVVNLNASGGSGNYTWSLASGSLPPGLIIAQSPYVSTPQIALVGVAITPGNYSFSLTVNDGITSVTQAFTMKITALTVKDLYNLQDAFVNTAYSYTFTPLNNAGPVTFAVTSPPLPAGLSLSPAGVLSGTPTSPGAYNINFSVFDGTDTTFRGYQIVVYAVDITTSGALPNATQGAAYSAALAASGGTGGYQYQFSGGGLPPGLSLSSAGVISGTPNGGSGLYGFSVTVTDSSSNSYQKSMSIDVIGPVVTQMQVTSFVIDATVGNGSGSQVTVCCGGTAPFTWTATGLPAGITIRFGSGITSDYIAPGNAEIQGVASTPGNYNVTVTVTDSLGATASLAFPFHVSVLGTTGGFPPGTINVPYSTTFPLIGGSGSYSVVQIGNFLPDGLILNTAGAATGSFTVTGTPLENGSFDPLIKVTDTSGNTLTINYYFNINNVPGGITINNGPNLGSAAVGNYSNQLSACCVASYVWSAAPGSLPAGLTLSPSGLLSGTVAAGTYTFLVKAADAASVAAPGFRQFTLNVTPISITTGPLPYGNVSTLYNPVNFTATGGTGTLTWSLASVNSNYLPPGLTLLPNGNLSGTPTATGQFSFSVTVTDLSSHTATAYYRINIYAAGAFPPVDTNFGSNLGTFTTGTQQFGLGASGGTGTYTWSLVSGSLPPGLALRTDTPSYFTSNQQAGLIGVATTPGTYNFTLRVTSGSQSFTQATSMRITALSLKDNAIQIKDAFVNTAYSYTFTALNGTGPVTFTSTNTLPPGLTLSSAGVLSGTPTTTGFYNVNFSIYDGVDTVFRGQGLNVYAVNLTTPGVLPNGTQNSAYSTTLTASGGAGGYTFTATCCLPQGLTLSSGGTISGTITSGPGKIGFYVTVKDSSGVTSYQKNMSIDVVGVPPALPRINTYGPFFSDPVVGDPYGTGVSVCCGGTAPFTWTATGLPVGMSIHFGSGVTSDYINPGDAEIWGIPQAAGNYSVQFTVTDSNGVTTTQTLPLHVSVLDSDYPPSGTVNVLYSATLRVLGGTGPYTTTELANTQLPYGLNFNTGTNLLSGTPAEGNATFNLSARFSDSAGNTVARNMYFSIAGGSTTISINNASNLGPYTVGSSPQFTLNECCVASYTWSLVIGTLPPGQTLSAAGQLSGMLTTVGTYTFVVKVADNTNASNVASQQFTEIVTPISFTFNGNLPYGNVGTAYSQTLTATGGTGTPTWTLNSFNYLPAGLTLASNGTISGTPTATGQFFFTVTVTDAVAHTNICYCTINVYAAGVFPPVDTNFGSNLGTFTTGTQQFGLGASGGTGTYTWSLVSGSLPPGLALRTDTPSYFASNQQAGLIGVATTPGTYNFTLQVTSGSQSFTQATSMRITALNLKDNAIQIPDAFVNTAYSYTFTALNGAGPVTFTSTNTLPPGLTLSSAGVLSGTPTAPGFYNVNFSIFDGVDTVFRGQGLNVYAVNITTPGALPNGTQNSAYGTTLTASGGAGGYTFTAACCLPQGLTLSSSGTISGTITSGPGKSGFNVTVRDSSGASYQKNMSIDVVGVPSALPRINTYGPFFSDPVAGDPYGSGVSVCCGGTAPFTWTATGLPSGMSIHFGSGVTSDYINPGDAEIWGIAQAAGNYSVQFTVTDATGSTTTQTFPLHVSTLDSDYPPGGTVNVPYSATLRVLGGTGPYSTTQLASTQLPYDLTFNTSTNLLSGTPLEANGYFPLNAQFSDSAGNTLTRNMYFFIAGNGPTTISINNGSNLGPYTVGSSPQFTLNQCCVASYTWSLVSGTLPPGQTLSAGGQLSGMLTTAGTYTFVVKVVDNTNASNVASQQFTEIVTPISFTFNGNLPYGNVGTAYSQTLTATGGTGTLTWTLNSFNYLPPGLTLASNGTISGTPTATGQFFFNVTVTDAAANTNLCYCTINIYAAGALPPPGFTEGPNLGTFPVGTIFYGLGASGGNNTYTWSLVSGTLPPGVALRTDVPPFFAPNQQAGLIGVATTPGTYNFMLSVTSGGQSSMEAFTMKVSKLNLQDATPPDAFVSTPFSYTFTPIGNAGPVTFTVQSNSTNGTVPPGLSLSSAGVLSGTPTTAGNYVIAMTIFDGVDTQYEQYNLYVYAVDITTPGVLPNGTQNSSYSTNLSASGGAGGYVWTATCCLPPGLTLSASGTISGTITGGPGLTGFAVTATDSSGVSYSKYVSIDVIGSPIALMRITNLTFNDPTLGDHYGDVQSVCCGGTAPFTWTVTGLPPGLTTEPNSNSFLQYPATPGNVQIYGVPQAAGTYNVLYTVTDATGASTSLTVPMHVSLLDEYIPTGSLPNGTINVPYTATFKVLGGSGPYSFTKTANGELPDGLTAAPPGALTVSGTPLENGGFNGPGFLFADSGGNTLFRYEGIFISGGASTITVNGNGFFGYNLGTTPVGASFSRQFSACCVSSYVWSVAAGSTLPPGLSLSASGLLSGTPTTPGTYTFLIDAADATNSANMGVKSFVFTITPITVTNPPLPFGNVGVSYSTSLTATGGTGALTWTLIFTQGSELPPGLTLNANGTITGTPTSAGAYIGIFQATDTSGNIAITSYTIDVYGAGGFPPLVITTRGALGTFTIGNDQINLNASGGTGNYTWSLASGSLPPGLNIAQNPYNSTPQIALTGIATTPGNYSFSLTVGDGISSVTQAFTLKITALTVKDPNLPDAFANNAYSYTLTPLNNAGPVIFTSTNTLPPGLTLSSAGVLSGTLTTPGFYSVDFSIYDGVDTTYRGLGLTVYAIDLTTPGVLPNATQGAAYSATLASSGGTGGYTYAITNNTNLPAGLSLSSGGVISGTPTGGTGFSGFSVTVTDSSGNLYQKQMSIDVIGSSPAQLRITLGTIDDPVVGNTYGWQIPICCGGTAPFSWAATGLPAGMSIRSGSGITSDYIYPGWGEIWGLATTPGTYNITLTVTDSLGATASVALPFHVSVLSLAPNYNLQNGTINSPYSTTFRIQGGSAPYSVVQNIGSLPDGLTLNTAAAAAGSFTVAGTPIENGNFDPGFIVTDGSGNTLFRNNYFNINNVAGGITINNGSNLGSVTAGTSYSIQLSACCVASYIWSAAPGSLPSGLTLSTTGVLSGTAGTTGTYTFLVEAADAAGVAAAGFRQFTLIVTPLAITTNSPLTYGNVGAAYSTTFTATGGTGTLTWTVVYGNYLPPGLSLAANGTLSGTPTATGQYGFGIAVADQNNNTATRFYVLAIYAAGQIPPLSLPLGPSLGNRAVGPNQLTFGLSATGGTPPYHYSLTPGTPAILGLRVQDGYPSSNTGAILALLGPGSYNTSARVTDSTGATVDQPIYFNVLPIDVVSYQASLPRAVVSTSYSFQFTPYGGSGSYIWSGSVLPPGLTLNSSTGVLSGTPQSAGTFSFAVILADVAGGGSISRSETLIVSPFAITDSPILPQATASSAYSYQFNAPNCGANCTWTPPNNNLPAGFNLSSSGLLTGTFTTAAGSQSSFYIQASGSGGTTEKLFTLTILPTVSAPLSISKNIGQTSLPLGVNSATPLVATGGTPPYTFTLVSGSLPPGMALKGPGETIGDLQPGYTYFAGWPEVANTYNFTIQVKDSAGNTATQPFSVLVSIMEILYSSLPIAGNPLIYNTPYSQQILVVGGNGNYNSWTTTPTPIYPGLSLNAATGLITGTPTITGFNFPLLTVSDSAENTVTSFVLINASSENESQTITFGPLASQTLGTSLPQLGATASSGLTVMFTSNNPSVCSVSGVNITLLAAGTCSITASQPGNSMYAAATPVTQTFTVSSSAPPAPPALTISSSAGSISTTPGGSVSASFSASGGTPPYTFTASGLPGGVTLSSSGSLSGSASQAGSFTASVTVTDSKQVAASTSITINVLGLTTTSLPGGTVGQVYFASLAASGGSGISFSATGLPPGLSLSGSGTVSGTPKTAGAYTLVVTVSSGGASAMGNVSLTIAQSTAVSISSATLPAGTVGVLYSQALTASGGLPPYTWSVISGAPPQGFSLSASGVVSGMPATAGAFMFGVQVTDTAGATATATASFTIQPMPLTITTKSLPSGMNTVDYPQQQLAVSGGVAPYTWALSGGAGLPAGMLLSTSGVVSGVPTVAGAFSAGVTVTDSSAAKTQVSAAFSLTIRPTAPDLILTSGSLGFALMSPATSPPASQSVGVQATVASAIVAYTASANPAVPWLALSNGTATPDSIQVSITSAALTLSPGSYQTTLTATCTSSACNGHTQSVAVSLTVAAAAPQLQISTNLLSFATTNVALGSLSQPINVQNVGGGSLGFASVSCEASYCTAAPPSNLGGGVSASIPVTVDPSSLTPGFYRTQVDIKSSGGTGSVPVTLFISANATMTLAPAGGLFNQNAGSAPGNPNGSFLVSVNSPIPVNYTATVLPGASWLVVGTAGGMSTSAQPGTVNYSINPAVSSTLAAGAYYGEIQITSAQVSDSPQDFEVVLNVAPAVAPVTPDPEPGGLLFLTTVGGVLPPQTVTVYSGSPSPLTFQASAATTSGGGWLSVTPTTGTASQSAAGVTMVSVNASKLSAGVYRGGVSYSLSATAVRTVGVTLIVSAGGTATSSAVSANAQPKASGCTPSKLVPAQTGLVDSFFAPAGWPTPLAVLLFDDCGSPVTNGQIVATFSNGDPPLALPLANPTQAIYSGTWSPANPSSQVTINVTASAPNFATATSPLTGTVVPNAVPLLSPNGTLHVFDSLIGGALAPGTIVEIFGQNLAGTTSTASVVPLPSTMSGSSVIIGGMQAPLYYVSPGQIDAQIPFELPAAQQYQVIISSNGALTTPQPIQLSAAAPGLAANPDGTLIAQHASDGSLVTAKSPAMAGEYVVAYLAGLGDTTVPVTSGTASPTSPLALPSNTLVLTIDGSPSPLLFAGLTPGLVGLYQMNFQVPAGLPAGNLTITVSQNGQPSNQTVLPYHP